MKHEILRRDPLFVVINILTVIAALISLVLSSTAFESMSDSKLLIKVFVRGILGLLFMFDAMYFVFAPKGSRFRQDADPKARYLSGSLLFLAGLIGFVTACLGYGVNGDPRLIWWK